MPVCSMVHLCFTPALLPVHCSCRTRMWWTSLNSRLAAILLPSHNLCSLHSTAIQSWDDH